MFRQAGVLAMSEQVLLRQMLLMGKVVNSTAGSAIRRDVFVGSTLQPQVGRYVRRVGRPRQDWSTEVLKATATKLGSLARMEALFRRDGWKAESKVFFMCNVLYQFNYLRQFGDSGPLDGLTV